MVQQSQDGTHLCLCSCESYSKQPLVQQSQDGAQLCVYSCAVKKNVDVQFSSHDAWNNLHQVR